MHCQPHADRQQMATGSSKHVLLEQWTKLKSQKALQLNLEAPGHWALSWSRLLAKVAQAG